MNRRVDPAVLALALALAAGCSVEEGRPTPGVRGPCSQAGGPLGGCEITPAGSIDSAEDACWKMVECGALAVARPDGSDACEFCDWPSCVRFIEAMSDAQYDLALACVEAASCDSLKAPGYPNDPDPPPCLAQGQP